MMKMLLTIAFLVTAVFGSIAQDKFFTRDGFVKFYSSTPVEDILAENNKLTAVLDESTGKIEFAALMKAFKFEKALMEEHFNENYVESSTYPKATFKGEIVGFKKGAYASETEVKAKGTLNLHGVEKQVEIPGTIQKSGDGYVIKSKFMVKPEEYKIEIPNTVRDNIAKEIEVTVDAKLAPLTK